jgi:trehalose-phosphatase
VKTLKRLHRYNRKIVWVLFNVVALLTPFVKSNMLLPSALESVREIAGVTRQLAIFLDYDGTLTPIVSDPQKALLSESMRWTLQRLVTQASVAILSGRDLDDLRQRVDIEGIIYAGSHGFEITGPRGLRKQEATEFLPALDTAEKELREKLVGIAGAFVERKRFSIAAHYRNVENSDFLKLERTVSEVVAGHRELRRMEGKKVYELLPDIDWDKGKAVLWLLETLGSDRAKIPSIYIGDDRTDEDAFSVLGPCDAGILVSEQQRPTAANYLLKDPAEVEEFLRELAGCPPRRIQV